MLAPHAPFDLIFADSGVRDPHDFRALTAMLRPGGRIVMDDVTPALALPADSPLRTSDLKRELFAGHGGLTWTEVVLPDLANSLLVGTLPLAGRRADVTNRPPIGNHRGHAEPV